MYGTDDADRIKKALLDKRVREAFIIAFITATIAIADSPKYPRQIDSCAAAGEQSASQYGSVNYLDGVAQSRSCVQVIIELVEFGGGPLEGRALDR